MPFFFLLRMAAAQSRDTGGRGEEGRDRGNKEKRRVGEGTSERLS